ncbi:MAG: HAD-IA family hydrolase [Anaeromassilibacillus sp.]
MWGAVLFWGDFYLQRGGSRHEPEIFEAALRFLGTKKAETVVFDDALYAVKAAKAAGFPVAAVYDSHEKNQEEICTLSDLYLKDLTQLDKLRNFLPV